MASRRSHAASHCRLLYKVTYYSYQSASCPEGTRIHQKPTASSEGAQLWDEQTPSHHILVPRSGTDYHPQHHRGGVSPPPGNPFLGNHMYPQLRCFAACSGFHDIGPAPRNPQLILNLLAFVGAWLRRDAIASYSLYILLIYNLN